MIMSDFGKFGRPENLHYALRATLKFQDEYNRVPYLNDIDDANVVLKFVNDMNLLAKDKEGEIFLEAVDDKTILN